MPNAAVALSDVNVEFDATLSVGNAVRTITITSVATHGLTARVANPPHPGDHVTVTHGSITVAGQIEWVKGDNVLIISGEPIDMIGLIGKQLGLGVHLNARATIPA